MIAEQINSNQRRFDYLKSEQLFINIMPDEKIIARLKSHIEEVVRKPEAKIKEVKINFFTGQDVTDINLFFSADLPSPSLIITVK